MQLTFFVDSIFIFSYRISKIKSTWLLLCVAYPSRFISQIDFGEHIFILIHFTAIPQTHIINVAKAEISDVMNLYSN